MGFEWHAKKFTYEFLFFHLNEWTKENSSCLLFLLSVLSYNMPVLLWSNGSFIHLLCVCVLIKYKLVVCNRAITGTSIASPDQVSSLKSSSRRCYCFNYELYNPLELLVLLGFTFICNCAKDEAVTHKPHMEQEWTL